SGLSRRHPSRPQRTGIRLTGILPIDFFSSIGESTARNTASETSPPHKSHKEEESIVTRTLAIFVCLGSLLAGSHSPVFANDMEPQVRFMQAGPARLIEDMQTVLSLTSPTEQEQTQKITDYLELSFIGMSFDRLIRM